MRNAAPVGGFQRGIVDLSALSRAGHKESAQGSEQRDHLIFDLMRHPSKVRVQEQVAVCVEFRFPVQIGP